MHGLLLSRSWPQMERRVHTGYACRTQNILDKSTFEQGRSCDVFFEDTSRSHLKSFKKVNKKTIQNFGAVLNIRSFSFSKKEKHECLPSLENLTCGHIFIKN